MLNMCLIFLTCFIFRVITLKVVHLRVIRSIQLLQSLYFPVELYVISDNHAKAITPWQCHPEQQKVGRATHNFTKMRGSVLNSTN